MLQSVMERYALKTFLWLPIFSDNWLMAITGKVWTKRPLKCSPAGFQLKEILPCRPLFAVHSRPEDTLLWFVASWLQLKRGRARREFLLSYLQTCTESSVSTMRLSP